MILILKIDFLNSDNIIEAKFEKDIAIKYKLLFLFDI